MTCGRGAFVVLEGIDRSGKSTLSRGLVEALSEEGGEVALMQFPDRTTVLGHVLHLHLTRTIQLPDESVHLAMSANRWEKSAGIEACLAAGQTVVCDRYCYSGAAYSMAKGNASMTEAWCKVPDRWLPQPDLVLYLDMDPAAAGERASFGGEVYEEVEFQTRVREKYALLRDSDAALPGERTWTTLNASMPPEVVLKRALAHVKAAQSVCNDGAELRRMWQSVIE